MTACSSCNRARGRHHRALQVNEFMGLEFCGNITQRTLKSCSRKSPFILCTGEEYLNEQGIDATTWELWSNHIALACMTVICLFIAYLKLCFMKKLS
ncbi:hypothetical protein NDU88_006357 [Pleurodeles waltl]|uniref:Uncharacterized protein n=1 Tax=Pleurodeles waltl TaxID=8319 RepID=A0AAV7X2D3_PLEWA|nr:hypothetical protein NDU88_006357 [Pleurodeles waltl]